MNVSVDPDQWRRTRSGGGTRCFVLAWISPFKTVGPRVLDEGGDRGGGGGGSHAVGGV